ncbi:MAG: hypothetical protein R3B90_21695 [Planctomycetaceae bacterium]
MPQLPKPVTGAPVKFSASTTRALHQAAEQLTGPRSTSRPRFAPREPDVVLIQNETGETLPRHSVVRITSPTRLPSVDPDAFLSRFVFHAIPPQAGGTVAVTIEPLAVNEIGRAIVSGIAQAKVDDTGHAYAYPLDDQTEYFTTGAAGPAAIIYREPGEGPQWAIVNIGGRVDDGDPFPGELPDGGGCDCGSGMSRVMAPVKCAAFATTTGVAPEEFYCRLPDDPAFPTVGGPHFFRWAPLAEDDGSTVGDGSTTIDDGCAWYSESFDVACTAAGTLFDGSADGSVDGSGDGSTVTAIERFRWALVADVRTETVAGRTVYVPVGLLYLQRLTGTGVCDLQAEFFAEYWNPLRNARFQLLRTSCLQWNACAVCVAPRTTLQGDVTDSDCYEDLLMKQLISVTIDFATTASVDPSNPSTLDGTFYHCEMPQTMNRTHILSTPPTAPVGTAIGGRVRESTSTTAGSWDRPARATTTTQRQHQSSHHSGFSSDRAASRFLGTPTATAPLLRIHVGARSPNRRRERNDHGAVPSVLLRAPSIPRN